MWTVDNTPGDALTDNSNGDILIQVGANEMHCIYHVSAGGDAESILYEGVAFSDAGDALTSFNKLRSSTKTGDVSVTYNPVITDIGTAFPKHLIPGGGFILNPGGQNGSFDRETVLKPNTDYLLRITNRAGSTQPASSTLEWYEPGAT